MYYKARRLALSNGRQYHLAAILYRNGKAVRIGYNRSKTHPMALRHYPNGDTAAELHAEMDVLRFAREGDSIEVLRFKADGSHTMAKPCSFCQRIIAAMKIRQVRYTDWGGKWRVLSIPMH